MSVDGMGAAHHGAIRQQGERQPQGDGRFGRSAQGQEQGLGQNLARGGTGGRNAPSPGGGALSGALARAAEGFEGRLAAAMPGAPVARRDAEERGHEQRPDFALTVLPGEGRPAAGPGGPVHVAADGIRHESRVERVMAAIDAEIAAGRTVALTRGGRGELTLSFPLPAPTLGIEAVRVVLDGARLELVLTGAGRLPEGAEAALRALAQGLAARHLGRTIILRREEGADGAFPNKPGPTQTGERPDV